MSFIELLLLDEKEEESRKMRISQEEGALLGSYGKLMVRLEPEPEGKNNLVVPIEGCTRQMMEKIREWMAIQLEIRAVREDREFYSIETKQRLLKTLSEEEGRFLASFNEGLLPHLLVCDLLNFADQAEMEVLAQQLTGVIATPSLRQVPPALFLQAISPQKPFDEHILKDLLGGS